MPNVFPSYQLDAQVALEFGLDEAVLQGIAEAGASVARGSSFSFSVLNPQLKVLSDTAIRQVFADTACTAAAKGEMVIVRGYVLGQRRFSTKADGRGNVRVGVTKVGKFNVEGSNAGLLSITDEAPQEFLQILSEVSTSPTSPANTPADIAAPRPVTGQGRIYVQQDRADDVRNGRQTIALLAAAGFKVEPRVEGTASKLTPNQPQIRYFNEADKPNATRVLETFKEKYPEAVLVPLKIQAPPGQLEVWLPRVKTPPDAATPSVNTPR